jgi:hypothetical protein
MKPENRLGIPESRLRDADQTGSLEGHKGSGFDRRVTGRPAIHIERGVMEVNGETNAGNGKSL